MAENPYLALVGNQQDEPPAAENPYLALAKPANDPLAPRAAVPNGADFSDVLGSSDVVTPAPPERPGLLSVLGSAIERGATSGLAGTLHAGSDLVDQTVQRAIAPIGRLLGHAPDPLGAAALAEESLGVEREIGADRAAAAQAIGGRPSLGEAIDNPLGAAGQYGLHLANIGGESLPIMAAAISTRNPELAAGVLGGVTGAQEYTGLRGQGVSRADAAPAAALSGMIEAAGESVGLPLVMGRGGGLGGFARAALGEGAQEVPVTIGQQLVQDQATGRETPVQQQLGDALDAFLVGSGIGAGGHGLSVATDALGGSAPFPNAAPRQPAPEAPQTPAIDPAILAAGNAALGAAPAPVAPVAPLGQAEDTADIDALLAANIPPDVAAQAQEVAANATPEQQQAAMQALGELLDPTPAAPSEPAPVPAQPPPADGAAATNFMQQATASMRMRSQEQAARTAAPAAQSPAAPAGSRPAGGDLAPAESPRAQTVTPLSQESTAPAASSYAVKQTARMENVISNYVRNDGDRRHAPIQVPSLNGASLTAAEAWIINHQREFVPTLDEMGRWQEVSAGQDPKTLSNEQRGWIGDNFHRGLPLWLGSLSDEAKADIAGKYDPELPSLGAEIAQERDRQATRPAVTIEAPPSDDTPDPPLDIRYGKPRLPPARSDAVSTPAETVDEATAGRLEQARGDEPRVMDFEQYAAQRGAGRGDIGEAGAHKRRRTQTDKQWNRIVNRIDDKNAAVVDRREALREEYDEAVQRGEIRPPSRIEKLKRTAAGAPDNESVKAARRILDRMGESYETPRGQPTSEALESADDAAELTADDLTPSERAAFDRQSMDRSRGRVAAAEQSFAASAERGESAAEWRKEHPGHAAVLQAANPEDVAQFDRDESARLGEQEAESLGLRSAVNEGLGKVGEKIIYLRGYEGLPDRLRRGVAQRAEQRGDRGRTAALYDSATKNVYLFTDVVRSPKRALFNAAHEIAGHEGLRSLLGDKLDHALGIALQNPTVSAVADAIASERNLRPTQRLLAAEEALAELAAAVRTGNFEEIETRYVVPVPEGIRDRLTRAIDNFLKRLKAMVDDIFGRHQFTDEDVRALLENAWQAVDAPANGELSPDLDGFDATAPDQPQTAAFRRWLGDSKVVDESGKPLVVYHGTARRFSKINMRKGAQGLFWMTGDRSAIERGEVGASARGVIMPLYAKIENPAGWAEYNKYGIGELKQDGYDGLILRDSDGTITVAAFDPGQIKSADRNRGTFDPDSPSILESVEAEDARLPASGPRLAADDVRRADRREAVDPGMIDRAKQDVADQIEGFRKLGNGRPKNPRSIARRADSVRSVLFDSVVSRARSLEKRNPNSLSLRRMFNQVATAPGDSRFVAETMNEATESRFAKFTNRVRNILSNEGMERLTQQQNDQLRAAMLGTQTNAPAPIQRAAKRIRKLMDVARDDLIAAGVEVGEVDDIGYLTRLYDDAKILTDEPGFLEAAGRYYRTEGFPDEVGRTPRDVMYGEGTLARFIAAAKRAATTDTKVEQAVSSIRDVVRRYRNSSNVNNEATEIQRLIGSIYERVAANYGEVNASAWLHKIKTPTVNEVFNGVGPSGAPLTKERVLSGAADTIMADYLNTNVLDILDTYGRATAKKIAMAERFGPKGERVQQLIDAAANEGVSKQDLDEAVELMESALGSYNPINPNLKSGLDALQAWTYLALLSRVTFSSAVEAITFAVRTGNLSHAVAPLVQAYRGALRTQHGKDLKDMALLIGLNGNKAMEEVMQNQLGGDYGMEPKWSKLVHRFMVGTLLTPLTRAQRAYGVGAATGYLRWISKNVVAGKRTKEMGVYLNELGIADHEAFAEWMHAQGALPDPMELHDENGRATPRGQDYMTAVRRMTDQTIQNPNASHRPSWMNNPFGRVAGSIMGFSYAAYENIIKREARLSGTLRREAGAGAQSRRAVAALGGVAALVVGQTAMSVLRELLFNAGRFEDKDDEEIAKEMVLLGLTRSFGLGSADPIIQYFTGLKYSKGAAETLAGASIGSLAELIDATAGLATDKNSPSTDTAEYRAMEQIYSKVITPIANAVLSRIPYLSAPAILAVSDRRNRERFAGMFFDEPERETELDRKYSAAVKDLETVQDAVKDQMALKPADQWADELAKLKKEYPVLLTGATLDVYVRGGKYGGPGDPKMDAEGRPKLKLAATGKGATEGSVMGELEGYPYWYRSGGKSKHGTTEGIQDRITDLNKMIKTLRNVDDLTIGNLMEDFGRTPAVDALRDQFWTAGEAAARKPASHKQITAVVEELQEARRAEKRRALEIIEEAKGGKPITRSK